MTKRRSNRFRYLLFGGILFLLIILVIYTQTIKTRQSSHAQKGAETVRLSSDVYSSTFLPYTSPNAKALSIELPNLTIDPTHYSGLQASGFHNDYISPANRLYMVQYKTVKDTEHYMDTRPIRRFNSNVYIIQASSEELKRLMNDPDVNFIENYHPHYKIHQDLINAWYAGSISPNDKIALTFSPFVLESQIKTFLYGDEAAKYQLLMYSATEDGQTYIIPGFTDRNQLFKYALNPWISEIRFISL